MEEHRDNPFQKEKEQYNQIEIPEELSYVIQRAVLQDKKRKTVLFRRRLIQSAASVAAVLFLSLTIGVNSSYEVAKSASKMPVMGSVAKVFTVRKYITEKAADEEFQGQLQGQTATEQIAIVASDDGNLQSPISEENQFVEEQQPSTFSDQTEQPDSENIGEQTQEDIEDIPLTGFEKWQSNLTIEQLKKITKIVDVEELKVEKETTVEESSNAGVVKEVGEIIQVETAKESTDSDKVESGKAATDSGKVESGKVTTDSTKAEGSSSDTDIKETISANDPETDTDITNTILLAAIEKEEVFLYGYYEEGLLEGVALRKGDTFTCYPWTYMDNRYHLPKLFVQDVDQDGEKEILILLFNRFQEKVEEESLEGSTDSQAQDTISGNNPLENSQSELESENTMTIFKVVVKEKEMKSEELTMENNSLYAKYLKKQKL